MARIDVIERSTKVASSAQPFVLDGPNETTAVLLLHGYTGQSSDMRYLAERLHDIGLTVLVPRYPGHGTNRNDFLATDWRDWLRSAIDSYLDLSSKYESVMVGGLSMGGVIASILASRFPIKRLALFAPAHDTVSPLVSLAPYLRWIVPPLRVKEPELHEDPEQQYLADQYWNWNYPSQVASLRRLMVVGRRSLPRVTVPTLIVVSEADLTVPASVADRIERTIGAKTKKTVILRESGHVVTRGVEKETVGDATVEWFGRIGR